MNLFFALIACVAISSTGSAAVQKCVPRQYSYSSVVCVCNSTYCDTVEPVSQDEITEGSVKHYMSTMAGKRLEPMVMKFSKGTLKSTVNYSVNKSATYQKIVGFGGALTDSVGVNMDKLSKGAQELLLRSYFGPEGIGYSLLRLPMGGSDFSTRYYSLDDVVNDTTLTHFSLAEEDLVYKIPLTKRIQSLSPNPVKLFTTAWSAPDWMKDIGIDIGYSTLKTEYYQLWAQYFIKYLDAYTKENVTFWGITPQNEPTHGTIFHTKFNNIGWTAETQLDWLANHLVPALQSSQHTDVKLILHDDQRPYLKSWMDVQLANEAVRKYASGMGVHWYMDILGALTDMDAVHEEYPDKFLLYTEASVVHIGNIDAVRLGSWERGEQYMTSILEVTNHWVGGWVDWNLVLDLDGGPNWANNTVDAAVIVNATAGEFYKQPMFYALAHISKFVPPGSVRIDLQTKDTTDVQSVAFLTPDNVTVIIFQNQYGSEVDAVISDPEKGSVTVKIPGDSMNTILYK